MVTAGDMTKDVIIPIGYTTPKAYRVTGEVKSMADAEQETPEASTGSMHFSKSIERG